MDKASIFQCVLPTSFLSVQVVWKNLFSGVSSDLLHVHHFQGQVNSDHKPNEGISKDSGDLDDEKAGDGDYEKEEESEEDKDQEENRSAAENEADGENDFDGI